MRIETASERPIAARSRVDSQNAGRGPSWRLQSEVLRLAGPHAELLHQTERPWSSVTFSGSRHAMTLAFDGINAVTDGEAFTAALPDHEFTIPHHLVADAAIASVEHRYLPSPRLVVETELLLLEDA